MVQHPSAVLTTVILAASSAPAALNFSGSYGGSPLGTAFANLSPLLNQTFFVGDGLTGTGTGAAQAFTVPDGATHLYLGIVDGGYFVGAPDYYATTAAASRCRGRSRCPSRQPDLARS